MSVCACGHDYGAHQTGEGPWTGFCGASGCDCEAPREPASPPLETEWVATYQLAFSRRVSATSRDEAETVAEPTWLEFYDRLSGFMESETEWGMGSRYDDDPEVDPAW